jgi:hypothetical protein
MENSRFKVQGSGFEKSLPKKQQITMLYFGAKPQISDCKFQIPDFTLKKLPHCLLSTARCPLPATYCLASH